MPSWLYHFSSIDSTNIYAIKRISEGLAHHGEVILADQQTAGRGQRGKNWEATAGENLFMSLIVKPELTSNDFALFSMMVAVVLSSYIETLFNGWQIAIKWPNDIYINDKKASGILIENTWKGAEWQYAVVGIGLNVNQQNFPSNIPNGTSLFIESGKSFDLFEIATDIRAGILNQLKNFQTIKKETFEFYNKKLFKLHKKVLFEVIADGRKFEATVEQVDEMGHLILLSERGIETFHFGSLIWHLNP